jgi:flagellar secretion chaperone FliS
MALAQVNTYLTNHYEGMTPEQLILLLFKGALDRIALTRQAIAEDNIQKRGENLSRVIAIVAELNAAVNPEMQDEGTRFLRGLYTAILAELPKVSMSNDTAVLDRTEKYLTRLKAIWENDVMEKSKPAAKKTGIAPVPEKKTRTSSMTGYEKAGDARPFSAVSV